MIIMNKKIFIMVFHNCITVNYHTNIHLHVKTFTDDIVSNKKNYLSTVKINNFGWEVKYLLQKEKNIVTTEYK